MPPDRELVVGSKLGITIVVMSAALMALIDITIVNVAISDIRASFGTPIDQIGWVSTGYMVANIVIIPMTGWFQRRFGFARYFAASVALFTLASALCGMAWSLPSLVVFRALQGLGGGAIIPTAQRILFARYPAEERSMAAALFGLGAISGPLLGPTLGGYLIEWTSWHWIFTVNVPIGIGVVAFTFRHIQQPNFRPPQGVAARVDRAGIALLAVGMGSLQYVLEEGNRAGWLESTAIRVLAAVAAIALITFIFHELETEQPIVDLRVFRYRSYVAATGVNFLAGFALFSGSFLFSLYAGSVLRYSALDIGRVFLVSGASSIVIIPVVGRLGARIDGRLLVLVGMSMQALSPVLSSQLTQLAGFWDLVPPNWLRSVGLGLIFVPISVLALSELPPEQQGNATGLFNLTRELGGSLGTAWIGTVLSEGAKRHGSYLSEAVTPYNPVAQLQGAQIVRTLGERAIQRDLLAENLMLIRVKGQALVLSFADGFRLLAIGMAAGLMLVLLLRKPTGTTPLDVGH